MGEQRAFISVLWMVINGGSASVSWQEQGVLLSAIRNLCLHVRDGAALKILLCFQVCAQPCSWWAHGCASLLPSLGLGSLFGSQHPAFETTQK